MDTQITSTTDTQIENLINALGAGDNGQAIKIMEKLIETLQSMQVCEKEEDPRAYATLEHVLESFTARKNTLNILLNHLPNVDFEGRKDVVQLFTLVIKFCSTFPVSGGATGSDNNASDSRTSFQRYLTDGGTQSILCRIVDSYAAMPELSLNYGIILREFCKYQELCHSVLDAGSLYKLFQIARHNTNFDLASDAFLSIKDMLTKHKPVSSRYILDNFDEFFQQYHEVLLVDDHVLNNNASSDVVDDLYVCQRQSLKLLSDMLLDRSFMQIMLKYINNDEYLKVHMQFLRSSSRTIQFEAFHVFKIFAANPQKKPRVTRILYQNRDRLIAFLDTFLVPERSMDNQFLQDKGTVIQKLKMLQLPEDANANQNQAANNNSQPAPPS